MLASFPIPLIFWNSCVVGIVTLQSCLVLSLPETSFYFSMYCTSLRDNCDIAFSSWDLVSVWKYKLTVKNSNTILSFGATNYFTFWVVHSWFFFMVCIHYEILGSYHQKRLWNNGSWAAMYENDVLSEMLHLHWIRFSNISGSSN